MKHMIDRSFIREAGLSPHLPVAANDSGPPASAPAANDHAVVTDLPLVLPVSDAEVELVTQLLLPEILALFDRPEGGQ